MGGIFRAARPALAPQAASSPAGPGQARARKASPGFTLIEVLMAAAILAIGLSGVATLIARSSVQDIRAGHISRAAFLIEEHLEQATRAQYSALAFASLTDTATSRTVEGVRYTLNCTLTDDTPVERCKEMTCTLSWDGGRARARYVYVLSPKF